MASRRVPMLDPLRQRDFRLLWTGDVISVLGDQFYIVALPWLVLQLSGSGLAVGTTLMLAAVPRALLMIVGGAASDRHSPRGIVVAAALIRGVLVAVVAVLVWTEQVRLPHVYALVFLFGVADAFAYPAFTTLVPLTVGADMVAAANALLYAAAYVCLLVGPALGGALIGSAGLSPNFVLDAVSFFFSAAMLSAMRAPARRAGARADAPARRRVAGEIAEGLRTVWNDPPMRAVILLIAAVNLAFAGPYTVGLSVLAKRVFGSATSLGVMFSAFGGGALAGSLLGGSIGRSIPIKFAVVGPCLLFSAAFPALGFARTLPLAAALACTLGLAGGFINVLLTSWMQLRPPAALLGRVMGLMMLSAFGLQPISYAIAGLLVDRHLRGTFLAGGFVMLAAIGWAVATRALSGMDTPASPAEDAPR